MEFEFISTKRLHEMERYLMVEIRRCEREIELIPAQLREEIHMSTELLKLVRTELERKRAATEVPGPVPVPPLRPGSSMRLRSAAPQPMFSPPPRLPPTPMPSSTPGRVPHAGRPYAARPPTTAARPSPRSRIGPSSVPTVRRPGKPRWRP